MPYNTPARVSDGGPAYEEMFAPGAFARDIEARNGDFRGVKFLYQHQHDSPLGRAVELRDDAAGLFGAFRVAKTSKRATRCWNCCARACWTRSASVSARSTRRRATR